jgi:hypothetical protein
MVLSVLAKNNIYQVQYLYTVLEYKLKVFFMPKLMVETIPGRSSLGKSWYRVGTSTRSQKKHFLDDREISNW